MHTTGTDVKHVANAVAVLTLGKDMNFRDYAQGAYRMRGIATGQRVNVVLVPEVEDLMRRELETVGSDGNAECAAPPFRCFHHIVPGQIDSAFFPHTKTPRTPPLAVLVWSGTQR